MREQLDPQGFVVAAYAVSLIGIALLLLFSWIAMRRAERRREETRRR